MLHIAHWLSVYTPVYALGMAATGQIFIKSLDKLKQKFATRTQGAAQEYLDGVNATQKSQSGNAIAAKDRYAAGVQAAVANNLYTRGLERSGDQGWKDGVNKKGASRFGPGAAAGQDKWAARFKPFAEALTSLTLPPRLPKGDPSNGQRSAAVQQKLRAVKLSGS